MSRITRYRGRPGHSIIATLAGWLANGSEVSGEEVQEDPLNISYFARPNGALSLAGCVRASGSVVAWPGTLGGVPWLRVLLVKCIRELLLSCYVRIDKCDVRLLDWY
ncbi:hypothetical protein E2C01_043359 [Portunus trituberculatus]|uniref:Uncharacterized protein n=1 Tax=Portunus trituberculatus TaxID=210409 RepID=A0A5B7FSR4_PORTR|nr:hypothetical protein [Portunus trituberculatus]